MHREGGAICIFRLEWFWVDMVIPKASVDFEGGKVLSV